MAGYMALGGAGIALQCIPFLGVDTRPLALNRGGKHTYPVAHLPTVLPEAWSQSQADWT